MLNLSGAAITTGQARAFAIAAAAVPALWAVLSLVHPFTFEELSEDGETTVWLFVHFAQLPLTILLSIALLALLGPMSGTAALIARLAVVVWAVLFSAFDSIAGIATGMLVEGGHIDAATYLFDHGTVGGDFSVLSIIAHPTWAVVAIAGGLAMRRNGARLSSQVFMYVSVPFALSHVGPFAMLALLSLAVAMATAPWAATRAREPVAAAQ